MCSHLYSYWELTRLQSIPVVSRLSRILEASWNCFHERPQKAPVGGQTGKPPLPSEVAGDRVSYDGAMQRYERTHVVHPLGIEMEPMVPSSKAVGFPG